ncbi:MAG: hypothetical protein J6T55_03360 [Alphaproteobacteria bacterium]|nr:hypothetical protein [Alphaproteobacteria bacterium]
MEKVDLSKYLVVDDCLEKGRICDSPEDIAATEAINQHMRKVVMDYRRRAAISWEKARGFVFCNNRVRS